MALNVYLTKDVLKFFDNPEDKRKYRGKGFTIDIVEMPLLIFFNNDYKFSGMDIFIRGERSIHDREMLSSFGSVVLDSDTYTEVGAVNEGTYNDILPGLLPIFERIGTFIKEQNIEMLYPNLDPDESGVLIYDQNGTAAYKIVSGYERPELMCQLPDGSTVMTRPYAEDISLIDALPTMNINEAVKMAAKGSPDAMYQLSCDYLFGINGADKDPEAVAYWTRRGADAGKSKCMFNMGLLQAKGIGVKKDLDLAVYWMEKAADHGSDEAEDVINYVKLVRDCMDEAEKGQSQAQADVALGLMTIGNIMSEEVDGTDDLKQAFMWAEASAKQNNPNGYWVLGQFYQYGYNVEKDLNKAMEIFKCGSRMGYAPCKYHMALCLIETDKAGENDDSIFYLLKQSAELGFMSAYPELGQCYEKGVGTEKNMAAAVECYEKSLEIFPDPELESKVKLYRACEAKGVEYIF